MAHFEGIEDSIFEILLGDNDLSCALIAASMIDEALKNLLEKYFINGKTTNRILSDNGMAGGLRAKADLAYVLGLIAKKHYNNIIKILEIRNMFGHNQLIITFESDAVSKLCNQLIVDKLSGSENLEKDQNRLHFSMECMLLIAYINVKVEIITKCEFSSVEIV